jgi:hypothetical protein
MDTIKMDVRAVGYEDVKYIEIDWLCWEVGFGKKGKR